MGNFYVNYTLHGANPQAVIAALSGRSALITPSQNNCVVVYDAESDTQNQEIIVELAGQLSRGLCCPVLVVLNHDDDILWYQLYLNGEFADEYNSSPNYFEGTAEASLPAGGDAAKLCRAFGSKNVAQVASILHRSPDDEGGYAFEVMRHAELVEALGISAFGVGASFNYITESGELPDGLDESELIKVNQPRDYYES